MTEAKQPVTSKATPFLLVLTVGNNDFNSVTLSSHPSNRNTPFYAQLLQRCRTAQ